MVSLVLVILGIGRDMAEPELIRTPSPSTAADNVPSRVGAPSKCASCRGRLATTRSRSRQNRPAHRVGTTPRCPPCIVPRTGSNDSDHASFLAQMHQLAEERPLTPSFENKWGPCIRLCVVGIVVLLITAIVVITTLYPRKRTLPEALFPGCPTELKVFTATLNYSVDPCEDFRGHVCSGGRKTTEFPQDTPRVLRHAWNSQGARFLEVGRTPRVAAALFDACIVQLSRDVGDLARVLRFFREWGIPWPAPTGGRYHAFDVLLDLVINWGVVVFFELKLNRRPGRTRHSLIINYIDASKPLQQWVSILRQQGAHVHYARTFYEAFGAGSTPTSQLERVLRMESSIMDIISQSARESSTTVPFKLEMGEIGRLTTIISASLWLTCLNKHLRPYALRPDDEVLMDGDAVTTALNGIFFRYSNDEILEWMAWWFVQVYSSVLSPSAAVASSGDMATASDTQRRVCYWFVETVLQTVLLYERAKHISFQAQYLPATMQPMFRKLQDAAIHLARSALWLDDDARSEAATIINRTKLEPELWHHDRPSSWSTAQQLQAFIGALPYKVPTAFQGWTQVAKFHREHFPGWPLYHSLLHLHSQFSLLVDYDYWKNSLYVVPAILSEPVFYPNGHEPINHGGLGFMLARQLVRALDVKGIFLDADRQRRNWLSKKSWEVLQAKVICAGNSDVLTDIAAIEVALEAYKDSIRSYDSSGAKIEEKSRADHRGTGSQSFSGKRLFFTAVARSQCGIGESSGWAGRHMSDFGRALSCPLGRPMNPVAKCSFFGS